MYPQSSQLGPFLCVALVAFAGYVTLDPGGNDSWNGLAQKPVHAVEDTVALAMNKVAELFTGELTDRKVDSGETQLASDQGEEPGSVDPNGVTFTANAPLSAADRK